ncbi:nuclear transport factor 2 family protein [Nodosilinea sp. LEGE 07298]|uniref:nuclear transport factor 2 family protein n=1 Tax=Nodosilinea sp. LEGE 07298 TaxID=2777970 RepID=UPI0018825D68|nr:nuclear transport factor 2 family protein [Nodosilinea sp. LEGE 07298]MBE9108538.1 nuclear transport factor 2 family protein [Nodosilinea sp. LEGE 07298]
MDTSAPLNPTNTEIEAHIRNQEARLYAAMLASDVAELDALVADDLLFVGPTGDLATKEMDLELHRTGGTRFHEFVPKSLDIRVWSDHFAFATAKIYLKGEFLGDAFAGDYCYTRVWRNGEKGWQIAGGSVSAIAG